MKRNANTTAATKAAVAQHTTTERKSAERSTTMRNAKPVVNAHYLLDLVQVFPDAAEIFYGVGEKLLSPLFVRCDAGEAILLPVRASRVVAEVAAARKAREDADQAIKAQAEAEGRDPEYINLSNAGALVARISVQVHQSKAPSE